MRVMLRAMQQPIVRPCPPTSLAGSISAAQLPGVLLAPCWAKLARPSMAGPL